MANYIKIEIITTSVEQSEILIAELSEINFYGFEENEHCLSAFIQEIFFSEDDLNKILSTQELSYKKTIIEEINWNEKWESEFEPILIDDFVSIRAAFHKPILTVKNEIIITPKMSFGTGHHATTYLMLKQMQNIDFVNKSVLDFGTGTGVLAIMAKKLGAKTLIAIDNDEWSINNAKENFIANNCTDITLFQKENFDDLGMFDIILANINLNVISTRITQFNSASIASANILLSGFLSKDENQVKKIFMTNGFEHTLSLSKNDWISMLLKKT